MISYQAGCCVTLSSPQALLAIVRQGLFQRALVVSLGSATLSYILAQYEDDTGLPKVFGGQAHLFGSLTSVMGFIFVFRMSHSYDRFKNGSDLLFEMLADFFDGAAIMMALARTSKADLHSWRVFNHTLIRLISLLAVVCYQGLSEEDEHCEDADSEHEFTEFLKSVGHTAIDVLSLDRPSLRAVAHSKCRPELVYQFIHILMADHYDDVLKVPPPLLTRVYQELGVGMIKYHSALKFAHVPYPFPLMAISEMALTLHTIACPFVFSIWCNSPFGSACFTFIVEFILWSMLAVSAEFDNPFGSDVNDIDALGSIMHLNHCLASLVEHCEMPAPTVDMTHVDEVKPHKYLLPKSSSQVTLSKSCDELKQEVSHDFADKVVTMMNRSPSATWSQPPCQNSMPNDAYDLGKVETGQKEQSRSTEAGESPETTGEILGASQDPGCDQVTLIKVADPKTDAKTIVPMRSNVLI